jgi:hypothetical protein
MVNIPKVVSLKIIDTAHAVGYIYLKTTTKTPQSTSQLRGSKKAKGNDEIK